MPAIGPFSPEQIIPEPLANAVGDLPFWFVIGGHAVRCFCPYRPSHDVDFGVRHVRDMAGLLKELEAKGRLEILERSRHTTHLRWNTINVSVFVLEKLTPFIEGRRLNTTGILATKLHAILDRGTRRDFFDLYVTLQHHRLGIVECLRAMRQVYQTELNEGLLLRALTYFNDAERESPLPGEGRKDWETVKEFFLSRVGTLLTPPGSSLAIQKRRVDVRAVLPSARGSRKGSREGRTKKK